MTVYVTNPGATGAWMSYSVVWHPPWRATVNGRPVPVYRADMAYKAVQLDPGENVVQFDFGSAWFSMLTLVFSINAAFWLIAVACLVWNL